MRPMHWNVIRYDFNGRKITEFDIFDHWRFREDVEKAYRKHRNDFDAFAEKVKGSLFYCFGTKCEYEVIVSAWPPSDRVPDRKIDARDQVLMNWDVFIEYVWTRCHERKVRGE